MYWSNLSAAASAAAAYQTGQTGYAVSHTPTAAATYTTQRAAAASTYETAYPTAAATHTSATGTYPSAAASTTYEYGYGRTSQTPTAATVVAYDSSKTYYAQPSSASSYTATDTHYQVTKAGYTNTNAYTSVSRPSAVIGSKSTYAGSYTGATAAVVAATGTSNYSSSSYNQSTSGNKSSKPSGGSWQSYKKGGSMQGKNQRPKAPPKPQQLHYCDVCKISCAGPQTYREHLDGQKHKKKEASVKTGPTPSRHGTILRCELCDVTCTGSDAYAAHIRGAKHQKVVKLHQKLGKPIPSQDPVVVGHRSKSQSGSGDGKKDDSKEEIIEFKEKEVEPVGSEYIEEMKNAEVISFNCKLCECKFNDPNAKEMHMKGRRHRIQYKKKVNPELVVEVKPSLRQRKIQEEKLRRQQVREELWRRREEERLLEEEERWYWEEQRRCAEEFEYYEWCRRFPRGHPNMPPPMMMPGGPRMGYMPHGMPMRRPDSSDDRHVLAKHSEIYPKEEELNAIQKLVSSTEKALKMVSDFLSSQDDPKDTDAKVEIKQDHADTSDEKKDGEDKEESAPRVLKGVMRVGILAKGLLLKGDTEVKLVVLCGEKPTRALLDRIADNLPHQLQEVSPDEKYRIEPAVEEAAITVRYEGADSIAVSVTITLTSPVMREQLLQPEGESVASAVKDPPDVLDKNKCLEALADLRHAKWFQARANSLQSCVMVIRILRDLRKRAPVWNSVNSWALELMCEKIISSAGQPLSPGDALRRIFEALSSGLLLPGSPGLLDPCEKDPADATLALTPQEREDITASAQHALRLIAFRQIHKVLGMDPIPPPKFHRGGGHRFNRKRRRNNSTGEGPDSEGGEGKKDKKDKKDIDESKMEADSKEAK